LAAVGAAFFVVQGGVAVAGHSAPAAPTAPTIFEAQANLVQPGPFPQNKQNETSIAQNPKDPMNLVAGANDEIDEPACTSTGCPFVANVGSSGVYYSFDGGVTWTQFSAPRDGPNSASYNSDGRIHTLPGFGNLAAQLGIPGLASDGDPALAFSSGGTVYYASLAGVRGTNIPDLLTVSSSVDGGKHWSDPVLATDKTNPVDFNDKEAIWVDKSTSPFSGNVYLSWTLFIGGPGRAEPIMFTRSTDGGKTWAPAQKLSASYNNNTIGGRQGSTIRTDSKGNVYVIWESGVTINGTKTDAQVFAKSTDGGVTFSKPAVISPVSGLPSPLPGSSFRNDSFPSADIDLKTDAVYVTWAEYKTGHGRVLLTKSADGGATWGKPVNALDVTGRSAFFPGVSVSPDGTMVSVATQALDDVAPGTAPGAGVVFYDSYFAKSGDGGASFSAPLKISGASSDPNGSSTNSLRSQFLGDYNTLISDDSHAWFIWTDTRNASSCEAVDAYRAGTAAKPDVLALCPDNFGNTDIVVATVSLK
jgi:hypothetical protein